MFHFVPFWIQKKNLDLSEFDNFGRLEFLELCQIADFFSIKESNISDKKSG